MIASVKRLALTPVALALCLVAGCSRNSANVTPAAPTNGVLSLVREIPVPNTGVVWGFDIAAVDPTSKSFYLADVTNAALDVVNTSTGTLTQQISGGFVGTSLVPPNAQPPQAPTYEGPDGVVAIPGTSKVFVGNVNNIKVVNVVTHAVTTIATSTSGLRTDEGCYDADDGLVMFDNPADSPPFTTWLSATTNAVVAKNVFTTSTGLEACVYDPALKSFLINNDSTPTNPTGELDVIPAASVVAGNPTIRAAYRLPGCVPGGLALGPGDDIAIACFAPQTLILSASTGAIRASITQVGGGDGIAYDPAHKRYYVAAFLNGSNPDGSGGMPVLGVIDASSRTWLANVPTSFLAHSVAVDPTNGYVYVPVLASPAKLGRIEVYAPIP